MFLEIHVDDDVLHANRAAWPDAAALLDALARRAEAEGAALCFRIREDFANGDRRGFLRGLRARGHEIGWHAHGTRLGGAVAALAATGVDDAARVGAPGLVQVELVADRTRLGRAVRRWRARRLLESAWALGLRVLTDRRAIREFGWQGRVPWVIRLGEGRQLVSLDVTADPFAWGVLRRGPDRVHHARGTLDWAALDALVDRRAAEPAVGGDYFGVAAHEHNFCALGSLRPLPHALDAFSRWLSARGPQLVRPTTLAERPVDPGTAAPQPLSSRAGQAWVKRATRRPPRGTAHPVDVDGRVVRTLWFPAPRARGIVVAVHGGAGGIEQRLEFLGQRDQALADRGWTLVVFDRTEGVARTPGNPVHVADTAAVLDAALAEARARRIPLRVLTWSGGLVPAVLSGLVGVDRLVDVEGPVDRYSLVPPGLPGHELTRAEVFDDSAWRGREALPGLRTYTAGGGTYVRVQGRPDHVHGDVRLHADAAVATAEAGRRGSARLVELPGSARTNGGLVLDALVAPA